MRITGFPLGVSILVVMDQFPADYEISASMMATNKFQSLL